MVNLNPNPSEAHGFGSALIDFGNSHPPVHWFEFFACHECPKCSGQTFRALALEVEHRTEMVMAGVGVNKRSEPPTFPEAADYIYWPNAALRKRLRLRPMLYRLLDIYCLVNPVDLKRTQKAFTYGHVHGTSKPVRNVQVMTSLGVYSPFDFRFSFFACLVPDCPLDTSMRLEITELVES